MIDKSNDAKIMRDRNIILAESLTVYNTCTQVIVTDTKTRDHSGVYIQTNKQYETKTTKIPYPISLEIVKNVTVPGDVRNKNLT